MTKVAKKEAQQINDQIASIEKRKQILLEERDDLKMRLEEVKQKLIDFTGVDFSNFSLKEINSHMEFIKTASTEEIFQELDRLKSIQK